MSPSRLPADELEARAGRRSAHLYATDTQFRDTAPLDAASPGGLMLDEVTALVERGTREEESDVEGHFRSCFARSHDGSAFCSCVDDGYLLIVWQDVR